MYWETVCTWLWWLTNLKNLVNGSTFGEHLNDEKRISEVALAVIV